MSERAGLVSAAVEDEVRSLLRQHGPVVWLDAAGAFTGLVDALRARHEAGGFPWPVVAFRGSYLEAMMALEAATSDLDRRPVLVHLPKHNTDSVKTTPVYEVYEAGHVMRNSLESFVTKAASGRVAPEALRAFLATPGMTVASADAWLLRQVSGDRDDLALLLEQAGMTWAVDALVGGAGGIADPAGAAVRDFLLRHAGMDAAWVDECRHGAAREDLGHALGAWLLCVEYVDDLRRPPLTERLLRLRDLPGPLKARCRELCDHLRERHAERYVALADLVESDLPQETTSMRPEDLGRIDTFRFEETRVLEAAIQAARAAAGGTTSAGWAQVTEWAEARVESRSLWISRDQTRKWAWQLLSDAARLGQALAAAPSPLDGVTSIEEAVTAYARLGAPVDQAHRHFEQRATALLEPRIYHFGELRELRGELRQCYRRWVDALCRAFTTLCRDRGYLPSDTAMQRTVFEQAVLPLMQDRGGDKVAFFLVDALRYEMAVELAKTLEGAGTTVDLRARLAELPTVTAVGMNVLAPVASSGSLVPARDADGAIVGFRAGEYTVKGPVDRARAMGARAGGAAVPKVELAEVCALDADKLKRKLGSGRLLLVQSGEIDTAGEAGLGLATFDGTLGKLRAAVQHLQTCGVRRIVITADHGFLLQDETTEVRPYGTKRDPDRRHIVAADARSEAGMVAVPLASLGYDAGEGPGYLLLREDSAVFATANSDGSFVHGGNSPEERVIPVLTITRQRPPGGSFAAYRVEAEPAADALGLRRLRVRVLADTAGLGMLDFTADDAVDVALRVPERPDIRVVLKDASGGGELSGGAIRAQVGDVWTEVFFALEGPADEKQPVEVYHPGAGERVKPMRAASLFAVSGVGRAAVPAAAPPTGSPTPWLEALTDPGHRKVMLHLLAHGSATEAELNTLLGTPRAVRQFAARFDELVRLVPFAVEVEGTDAGKRYVRVRDER